MNSEMMEALENIEREKGISTEIMLEALANALLTAYKRMPDAAEEALVEIKAVPAPDKSGNRVNEFNMNISIKRAQAEPASGRSAAARTTPSKTGVPPGGFK